MGRTEVKLHKQRMFRWIELWAHKLLKSRNRFRPSSIHSFALDAKTLTRLTPIRSTRAYRLLVAAHAGSQRDVDTGRRREAEALGYLDQIESVHIEDGSQAVRCVCLQV